MERQTKKILCIEDDAFLLSLISSKFTDAGITAVSARNAVEGILLATSEHPDLILLDQMLPDIAGIDLLDKLKGDEATRNIPVVIFSNLAEKTEIERALAHGAESYLVKSNTLPSELVEVIAGVLGL